MSSLFVSASMRRLLPEQKRRTAPWIVGLMTFVSLIVGAAGLAVLGSVQDLRLASEGRWSLQVTGIAADAAAAERLLRSSPEVLSVEPVPEADLRSELARWLGPDADQLNLPLPKLADVALKPGADGAALAQRLQGSVGSARLSPYADELAPLLGSLQALSALVLGLLLVLALAMAAAVTLAARAALEANRTTLDIYHGIGATDEQLLSLLQRRIALDALIGGVAGGIAAVAVLALVALPGSALLSSLAGGDLFGPAGLMLLLLLPVAQALLATLVARRALKRALAATP